MFFNKLTIRKTPGETMLKKNLIQIIFIMVALAAVFYSPEPAIALTGEKKIATNPIMIANEIK